MWLHEINFILGESQVLANILSLDECEIQKIWINGCIFADDSGKLVSSALSNNESLKEVALAFCKELLSCFV
jgi:hypothetical protein